MALLELADPPAVGAGEGPLLVAEQLALQQGLRDGGAVDRQERPWRPGGCSGRWPGPPAPCRCRSRPGSAPSRPAARPGRSPCTPPACAGQRPTSGVRRRPRAARPPAITAGTRMSRLISKARATRSREVVELQRLEQVLVGPEPHRLDGGGRRAVPGDEDDRDLRGRSAWMRRNVSSPDASGRLTSRMTTSGRSRVDRAPPPRPPSAAVSEASPPARGRPGGRSAGSTARRRPPAGWAWLLRDVRRPAGHPSRTAGSRSTKQAPPSGRL